MVKIVLRSPVISSRPGSLFLRPAGRALFIRFCLAGLLLTACPAALRAVILWSDSGSRVIHNTFDGADILGGKVKRDNKANDALYFRFRVDPLSDPADEHYAALFQLVETNQWRLGVGNAWEAWGYSAAYTSDTGPSNKLNQLDSGEFNLQSSHPEAAGMGKFYPYELPSHNHPRTIVFTTTVGDDGSLRVVTNQITTLDQIRYPNVYDLDLRLAKNIKVGASTIVASVDCFNLFNSNTELSRNRNANSGAFNQLTEILNPRVVRFGLRWMF